MQSDIDDVLKRLQDWSRDDLEKLRTELDNLIWRKKLAGPLYDVRDFEGIGHGTWIEAGGIDEFIRQERASWSEYEKRLEEGRDPHHKARDFRGVGKETRKNVDVEEYLRQERASWDEYEKRLDEERNSW